mgnify:FL=1
MFYFNVSLNPHLIETGSQEPADLLDDTAASFLTPISFELKTSDLPG